MPYRLIKQEGCPPRRIYHGARHGPDPHSRMSITAAAIKGGLSALDLGRHPRYCGRAVQHLSFALAPGRQTRRLEMGGLHDLPSGRSILTDSAAGFQVSSLAKLRYITEEGVTLQSTSTATVSLWDRSRACRFRQTLALRLPLGGL